MNTQIDNANIVGAARLTAPATVKSDLPLTSASRASVLEGRRAVRDILLGDEQRLLVVVGPCSIHDPAAALEYAGCLRELADEVGETLAIVMRTYFEKPRTTVGWKGFINDPHLDGSFEIETGIRSARRLLLELAELGLPLATEALDPITPQYLHDLISWSAIGARTTESQTHREMASGLSSAVGFKNGTDGDLGVAINALLSVSHPHRFLGINALGQVSVIETAGNPLGHVVLRGGNQGPNFAAESIERCEQQLAAHHLAANIMVDCSHANSNKDYSRQAEVARDVARQIVSGNQSIMGLMLESHLHPGAQKMTASPGDLAYGVSITDACMGWDETAALLRGIAAELAGVLPQRSRKRTADAAA